MTCYARGNLKLIVTAGSEIFALLGLQHRQAGGEGQGSEEDDRRERRPLRETTGRTHQSEVGRNKANCEPVIGALGSSATRTRSLV
jgi:hypothetical protein